MPSTFLTAEWRKLLMAQYEVQPELLKPYLPRGLELDLYHPPAGHPRCYVSLVAFLFDKVRLKGLPVPFHTRFEEVNLRFYVRPNAPDGASRRGVVFIREFVPRHAITFVASKLYDEPYRTLPTRHTHTTSPHELAVHYRWRLGHWHSLSATAHPESQPMAPGSEEEFITEHYWGYTRRRNGRTSAYQVHHPRWRTYPLRSYEIAHVDFATLYGPPFASLTGQPASSVLLAEGSPVSVDSGQPLPS